MPISTVFMNNRTQAVRLPAEVRFPASVKKVKVRAVGNERIITAADAKWDSFFLAASPSTTDDFMLSRASQKQSDRDSF